jgi:hypothetical protein
MMICGGQSCSSLTFLLQARFAVQRLQTAHACKGGGFQVADIVHPSDEMELELQHGGSLELVGKATSFLQKLKRLLELGALHVSLGVGHLPLCTMLKASVSIDWKDKL